MPNCDDKLRPRLLGNKKWLVNILVRLRKYTKLLIQKNIGTAAAKAGRRSFIIQLRFHLPLHGMFNIETAYSNNLNMGHFEYNVFRNSFDAHDSRVLINKS